MTLVAVLVGALVIGSALGLLGGGGTILTVPLLHGLLGVPTPQAVAMSLPIVAIAAASGAVVGWRRRAFAVTPTLGLAVTTAAGAYAGALVGQILLARTQSTLLGITLVAAAIAMWRGGRGAPAPPSPATQRAPVRLALAGMGVGLVTGLVGVGGGFLIVPALVTLGGYALAEAVPASLFVIAVSATSGAVGYRAVPVAWGTVLIIAVTAAAGVVLGAAAGRRLAPRRLRTAFSFVLVAAAGYVLAAR